MGALAAKSSEGVAEVVETEGGKLRLAERALEHLPHASFVVRVFVLVRVEPLGLFALLIRTLAQTVAISCGRLHPVTWSE